MTQHPSLRSGSKNKQHRSVLKRFERLKHMKEKGEWEDDMSILGLPKIKIVKFKIKKEKAAVAEEAVAAAGAGGAAAAEGAPAKEGAQKVEKGQAKGATPKAAESKKEEKPKK